MLRLLYQTFRALMKPALDRALIRRIFELKMLVINGGISGYVPLLPVP